MQKFLFLGASLLATTLAACGESPPGNAGGGGSGGLDTTSSGGSGAGTGTTGAGGQGGAEETMCAPGSMDACYSGPPGTELFGSCREGKRVCNASGTAWGPCEGEVVPQPDSCTTTQDEDCDGDTLEGCACPPGKTIYCYDGLPGTSFFGICKAGEATCLPDGSAFGPCEGQVIHQEEICNNGLDDDCDGKVDGGCVMCAPGAVEPCFDGPSWMTGVGQCSAGTHTCKADGWGFGACVGQGAPAAESCASPQDDDCDGVANEGCEPCLPGAVQTCYTGPVGTLGVAGCHAGTRTCLPNGTSFGPCAGQGLPKAEVCGSAADESCDGSASCSGTQLWSKGYSMTHGQSTPYIHAMAVDGKGNMFIAGQSTQFADFGAGTVPADSTNAFVVKLDPSGNYLWSMSLGASAGAASVFDLVLAPNGDAIIAGSGGGTLAFDGFAPITSASYSPFVARLDPEGKVLWRSVFRGRATARALALDTSGDIVLTGTTDGVDLGGGVLVSHGNDDIFLARFTGNGAHLWSKIYGSAGREVSGAVALSPAGDIALAAWGDSVNFGGGVLTAKPQGYGIFVAKLDAAGNHIFSKNGGDATFLGDMGIAMDPAGDVVVTGTRAGVFDLGAGPSPDDFGAYVVRLGPSGAHKWTRLLTSASGPLGAVSPRFDAAGNIVLAGQVSGDVDFGAGVVIGGGFEAFVAKYDPAGTPIWVRRFDCSGGTADGNASAVDVQGNVFLGGSHNTSIKLGNDTWLGAGLFFMKLTP